MRPERQLTQEDPQNFKEAMAMPILAVLPVEITDISVEMVVRDKRAKQALRLLEGVPEAAEVEALPQGLRPEALAVMAAFPEAAEAAGEPFMPLPVGAWAVMAAQV